MVQLLKNIDCSNDSRSRRTGVTREDNATWTYGYNNRDEVESGVKKFSDSTNIPGQDFAYAYDSIGNPTSKSIDGTSYAYGTVNSVNQLTTRVVPSDYVISGSAESLADVKVNNSAADRKGDFWSKLLSVSNSSAPAYETVTIKGKLTGAGPSGENVVAQQTGHLLVAKTPETFTYDDDGNLISDGLWNYTWDGENRLIAMESGSTITVAAKKKLTFAYDGLSRRIQKKVYIWNTGTSAYALQKTVNFVYDKWNLVAETDGTGTLICSYAWGLDLSGTEQGAGGVGGLLVIHDAAGSKNYYASADGNGNVSKLIASPTGDVAANYEYSPFGEVLVQSDDLIAVNPFQWSSKYCDQETKLSYYGFRYYNPILGRWLNRDPIEELGGINLYSMGNNETISDIDNFGLATATVPKIPQFKPVGSQPSLAGALLVLIQLFDYTLQVDQQNEEVENEIYSKQGELEKRKEENEKLRKIVEKEKKERENRYQQDRIIIGAIQEPRVRFAAIQYGARALDTVWVNLKEEIGYEGPPLTTDLAISLAWVKGHMLKGSQILDIGWAVCYNNKKKRANSIYAAETELVQYYLFRNKIQHVQTYYPEPDFNTDGWGPTP